MSHTYQNLELGERASLSGRTSDDAASSSYEDEPSLFRQYRTWLTGLGVVGVVCLVGCVAFASRPATTAATTTTAAAGPLLAATTVDEFDSTAASSFVLSSSSAGSSKSLDKAHKSAELATATAEAICLDPDYTKVTLKTANEMTMVRRQERQRPLLGLLFPLLLPVLLLVLVLLLVSASLPDRPASTRT